MVKSIASWLDSVHLVKRRGNFTRDAMCTGSHYIRHAHPFTALVDLLLIDGGDSAAPENHFSKLTYRFSPLFKFLYVLCFDFSRVSSVIG